MHINGDAPVPTADKVRPITIAGMGTVYFTVQRFFLTISEEFRSTYSFDSDGRFVVGFFEGVNYQRSLESSILQKSFAEDRTKIRRFLSEDESRNLIDDVRARVQHIRARLSPTEGGTLGPWLDRILGWDFERLQAERERFQSVYRPISILPPDQYLSVVLQATEGCSWNQCTFCTFYRDRRFKIKSPAEFRQHARQVKQFFGDSIGLRKSIFLADANALIIPQQRLLELLRVVQEEFSLGNPRPGDDYTLKGIYSFLDIFGAERKTLAHYRELREHGVSRIYIGLETGDDEVFGLLNKPGSPRECIEAVRIIKAAGIDVGIILLAGAGGDRLSQQHLAGSLRAIEEMQPGPGDIIYVSPLIVAGDDEYSQRLRGIGARALHMSEVLEQINTFKAAFKPRGKDRPRVTLYHIEEFLY